MAQEMGVAPSLPASPWDTLAGQGEWGKRPPTAFASSIPPRGESCGRHSVVHSAARGNEEGGSGQPAALALFITCNEFVLI